MEYFSEDVLRDYGDESTNLMLDLWHKECVKYFNNDIEVIMADRRHNPQLRDIPGIINSASPHVFDAKMHLTLWLESVYPLEPILVTHELGHWILVLRGYKMLVDPGRTFGDIVVNLNSLEHHPPLFTLQRSLGHEPQDMIDHETKKDIDYYNERKERDSQRWISDALYITDHLTNCSDNYRLRLNNVLRKRLPNTNRFVRIITDILNTSDLHSAEQNLKFCYKLTKELKLGKWTEFDQLLDIAAHFSK